MKGSLMESFNRKFDKKIDESFKIISSLSEYEPWSGAVDTWNKIVDADKLDEFESLMELEFPDGLTVTSLNDHLWFDGEQVLSDLGISDYPKTITVKVWGIEYEDDVDATEKPTGMTVEVEVENEYDDIREKVHDAIYDELPTGIGYYDISDFEFEEVVEEDLSKLIKNDLKEAFINTESQSKELNTIANTVYKALQKNRIDVAVMTTREPKYAGMVILAVNGNRRNDLDRAIKIATPEITNSGYEIGDIKVVPSKTGGWFALMSSIKGVETQTMKQGSVSNGSTQAQQALVASMKKTNNGKTLSENSKSKRIDDIDADADDKKEKLKKFIAKKIDDIDADRDDKKEKLKESDKPAATSIEDAQKWVDYDMKKYGKISERTNRLVRKAGFQIVKDTYGDYEVIAGHYE